MAGDPNKLRNPNPGHCRSCDKTVDFPRQYCDEHRPAQRPKKATGAKQRNIAQATPVKVISDSGAAAGKQAKTGRAPSVEATTKVLARVLVYATIFIAMALVNGDPGFESEEAKEAQVGELQLKDEDAKAIAHPLSRALAPTKIWAKYGGAIIEHSDVLDALAALYDYATSLARYKRQRTRRERGAPVSNGHVPREVAVAVGHATMAPEGMSTDMPAEGWGRQIGPSAEQLEEIRRRKAAEWGSAAE